MQLYAISDLHLGNEVNRRALEALPTHPEDWLIVAGDVGETAEHLRYALTQLSSRFAKLIWVPGNHDLWTLPSASAAEDSLRGEEKYLHLVEICHEFDVLTPEDPYVFWPGDGQGNQHLLVPLFLLYDYSFRPDDIPEAKAVEWAKETRVVCSDEYLLHPDPYPSRSAWCHARCDYSERRLDELPAATRLILINHFPLRRSLIRLRRIPRFSIWCGTRRTEDWPTRFPVDVAISGHLHMRSTDYQDHVRFEEVSLGYPRQWPNERGLRPYLRKILPGPAGPMPAFAGPDWHW